MAPSTRKDPTSGAAPNTDDILRRPDADCCALGGDRCDQLINRLVPVDAILHAGLDFFIVSVLSKEIIRSLSRARE